MEQIDLAAEYRSATGKGAARKLRQAMKVPAVLYGAGQQAIPLTIEAKDLMHLLKDEHTRTAILNLNISGLAESGQRKAILREVQCHPVTYKVLHVDLYEISMDRMVTVEVPVELEGVAVGVKDQGGILEHVLRKVEVECLPDNIPEAIKVDVSGLRLGKSLHVADIVAPPGVRVLEDAERVVASVIEKQADRGAGTEGEAAGAGGE